MRVIVNPYTGVLMDLDTVPVGVGGAQVCPTTGQPLNREAVELHSYPGPQADREKWAEEALATVRSIDRQAKEPNATTLGVKAGK